MLPTMASIGVSVGILDFIGLRVLLQFVVPMKRQSPRMRPLKGNVHPWCSARVSARRGPPSRSASAPGRLSCRCSPSPREPGFLCIRPPIRMP